MNSARLVLRKNRGCTKEFNETIQGLIGNVPLCICYAWHDVMYVIEQKNFFVRYRFKGIYYIFIQISYCWLNWGKSLNCNVKWDGQSSY